MKESEGATEREYRDQRGDILSGCHGAFGEMKRDENLWDTWYSMDYVNINAALLGKHAVNRYIL